MANDYFHRVQAQTATRFWINNVTREETRLAIEAGAVGCTQNPTFPYKMLTSEDEGERSYVVGLLDAILARRSDDDEAQVELQRALVENVARSFRGLFDASGGAQGFVSIQGDPFREDAESIVKSARFNCTSPNIMAKVPATADGLKAIAILAAEGVPINATEVMTVRQALDVAEVHRKATQGMRNRPVIYYSHIAGIFDEYLQNLVKREGIDVSPDALWQAGIAVAKKAYAMVNDKGLPVGFISGGARGLHHFTEMVGAAAVVTINWKGTAEDLLLQDPPVIQRFLQPTPASVVDELCAKLPDFRKAYFVNGIEPEEYEHYGPVVLFRSMFESAWEKARGLIAARRRELKR